MAPLGFKCFNYRSARGSLGRTFFDLPDRLHAVTRVYPVACLVKLNYFTTTKNKAVEFSKLQICVDLFLFSAGYTDVSTLVNLPKFTAGQLFYYPVSAL